MTSAEAFEELVGALGRRGVRYVLIGVGGANMWARASGLVFVTEDRDLFVPPDPTSLLAAWEAARETGFALWAGDEPLGDPLDDYLASRVVERRALTSAIHPAGLEVDLTMVMAGFDFATVWRERRDFTVAGHELPVARLSHIVESKARADRPKDRLFLATWEDALTRLLKDGME